MLSRHARICSTIRLEILEIASKAILIDLRLLLFANDDEEQVFLKANWMM